MTILTFITGAIVMLLGVVFGASLRGSGKQGPPGPMGPMGPKGDRGE